LNGEQLESKKRGRKKKEDKVIKMNDFSLVD